MSECNNSLDCEAGTFRVTNPLGKELFFADHKTVKVGASTLKVSGPGGAVFEGSVQTPLVRAEDSHELRLESPTRSIEVAATQGITVESRAGSIEVLSLTDIKLSSIKGEIVFDSKNVRMPELPRVNVSGTRLAASQSVLVYQIGSSLGLMSRTLAATFPALGLGCLGWVCGTQIKSTRGGVVHSVLSKFRTESREQEKKQKLAGSKVMEGREREKTLPISFREDGHDR
ncbi:unnamed protein product [Cyprideis torosa]|uniref:Uncharacterized protein n=1 Tax=Cyprideis torosa TaxID=163714 RepID=A0A7R8W8L1_9CRUS|nr:unnamed protein product [Cyprideis torosa]CAG0883575.1 unnamed protein product [Cyprideis torosa]